MTVRKRRNFSMCSGRRRSCLRGCARLASAQAGHEVNYYPSFYPQEIRIEPLDPERRRDRNSSARPIRCTPISARRRGLPASTPSTCKSVVSLGSFITASVDAQRRSREPRGALPAARAAAALLARADVVVASPIRSRPIMPTTWATSTVPRGKPCAQRRAAASTSALARSVSALSCSGTAAAGSPTSAIDEVAGRRLLRRRGLGLRLAGAALGQGRLVPGLSPAAAAPSATDGRRERADRHLRAADP